MIRGNREQNSRFDAELSRKLDVLAEMPGEISPELQGRIQRELTRSLEPVVPLPPARISAAWFLLVFTALAVALILWIGISGVGRMSFSQLAGMSAVLIAGAGWSSIQLARQLAPGSMRRISTAPAIALFALAVLAGTALLFPWRETGDSVGLSWQCLPAGLAIAIPSGVLFWLLLRRGVALSETAKGASVGAISGLLGVTVLQFWCIHQQAFHLLMWHWSVLVITTGGGALLGPAITARSHASK
jgi:hypothetical protein